MAIQIKVVQPESRPYGMKRSKTEPYKARNIKEFKKLRFARQFIRDTNLIIELSGFKKRSKYPC